MDNLRLELLKITENGKPKSHPDLIEKLKAKFSHTIIVEDIVIDINKYTCILYVFGIIDNKEYIDLALKCPKTIYANTEFLQFLIDNNYLKPAKNDLENELLIYFENNKIRHIGRIIDENLVISKWGTGHLYKHPIFEVPANYGNEVKYFLSLSKSKVLGYFIEFAKSKGVSFL